MRYASIRTMDISNADGIAVSLFAQGCPIHCKNCFNKSTWDFNGGKEFDQVTHDKFMELIARPYINRVSFLGGEPLSEPNAEDVANLVAEIRIRFQEKKIWIYTGYTWETLKGWAAMAARSADVVVDGAFKQELQDFRLAFRGSSNQRIIDVKKTINSNHVIEYEI